MISLALKAIVPMEVYLTRRIKGQEPYFDYRSAADIQVYGLKTFKHYTGASAKNLNVP
jgi:hypothetical protein